MRAFLFFFLLSLQAKANLIDQIIDLDCIEEIGSDKEQSYTTHIILTKIIGEKQVQHCAKQIQELTGIQPLSVNNSLGLIVVREGHCKK